LFVTDAAAAPISISSCYTGDCGSLTGSVIVTITDDILNENAGSDDIKLVIQNLTNGFVDEIGLQYSGGLPGLPAIEGFTPSHSTGQPSIVLGECQNDNSGQSLNVCFDFPNSNASRLKAGQSVTFFLDSNVVSFDADLFMEGRAYAHIQGLPEGGSVKIIDPPTTRTQVPEPASILLLGSGVAAVTAWRQRRRGASD
jgi:hypothetical protein